MVLEFLVTKEVEASCDVNHRFAKTLRKTKWEKLTYS